MSWNEWRRRLAEGTEPSAEHIDRVHRRIRAGTEPATAILRAGAPDAGNFAVARVHARLRAGQRQPSRARPLLGGAFALAIAAALLVVVLPGPIAPAEPATIELATGTIALSDIVGVTGAGRGTARGVGASWTIDWQGGELGVAVVPHAGAQVEIRTAEASVRVIGTRFVVTSDALGTRVSVTEGKVAVGCADGTANEIVGGEAEECLPVTSTGLLARAIAQSERGDAPAEVLETLDRGLAVDGDADVDAELLAARIDPLLALGRTDEARAAADLYLRDVAAPRADEIGHVAGRLALAAGDCAAAIRHLASRTDTTPDEAAWLDRCAGR